VDEIEAAGMVPPRVHARKAKLMLGIVNTTDTLDARGLKRLHAGARSPRSGSHQESCGTTHTPLRMEDFVVTCHLVPGVPHLISGFCSSPRIFGLGFLQTPPRDDALALLLTFGSASTWCEDFHLTSSVPCPAHTARCSAARAKPRPLERRVGRPLQP